MPDTKPTRAEAQQRLRALAGEFMDLLARQSQATVDLMSCTGQLAAMSGDAPPIQPAQPVGGDNWSVATLRHITEQAKAVPRVPNIVQTGSVAARLQSHKHWWPATALKSAHEGSAQSRVAIAYVGNTSLRPDDFHVAQLFADWLHDMGFDACYQVELLPGIRGATIGLCGKWAPEPFNIGPINTVQWFNDNKEEASSAGGAEYALIQDFYNSHERLSVWRENPDGDEWQWSHRATDLVRGSSDTKSGAKCAAVVAWAVSKGLCRG